MGHHLKVAFILWNLYALFTWALPPFPMRGPLNTPVRPYMQLFGLWQSWDLFAPDVLKLSTRLSAKVKYKDGHVETWGPPTESDWPILAELRGERVRKFTSNIRQNSNKGFWPHLAEVVGQRMARPSTEVEYVALLRHWKDTPSMPHGLDAAPEKSFEFYRSDKGETGER